MAAASSRALADGDGESAVYEENWLPPIYAALRGARSGDLRHEIEAAPKR